ncbi:N-acetylmuramoyl-L-alanine amidase, partial [Streptomyces sp. WAC05292]
MRYDDSPPQPETAPAPGTDRRRFARRSALAVAAAVIAPTTLAGWVLVQVGTGAGADDARPPRVAAPAAAATGTPAASPTAAGTATA